MGFLGPVGGGWGVLWPLDMMHVSQIGRALAGEVGWLVGLGGW